jgi:hypothetical protein
VSAEEQEKGGLRPQGVRAEGSVGSGSPVKSFVAALHPGFFALGAALAVALVWLWDGTPPKGGLVWFVFCLGAWWRDWAVRA